jgi:hypothetical protein
MLSLSKELDSVLGWNSVDFERFFFVTSFNRYRQMLRKWLKICHNFCISGSPQFTIRSHSLILNHITEDLLSEGKKIV